MIDPAEIQKILDIVNTNYENGECQINEYLPKGERGDGLADFIRVEVSEVVQGSNDFTEALKLAEQAMATASAQLEELRDSIVGYLERFEEGLEDEV